MKAKYFKKYMITGLVLLLYIAQGYAEEVRDFRLISHNLEIELMPVERMIKASDHMIIEKIDESKEYLELFLHQDLSVHFLSVNSEKLNFRLIESYDRKEYFSDPRVAEQYGNAKIIRINLPGEYRNKGKLDVKIHYSGLIYDELKIPDYSRGDDADQTSGIICGDGVFLFGPSHWYPHLPESESTYRISVFSPKDYEVVSEGLLEEHQVIGNDLKTTWVIDFPLDSCTLVAGKYTVTKRLVDDIELSTYFFPEDQALSEGYLDSCETYMKMYHSMIGSYPFKKFAVVENFFSTGYGMPSYTLLGQKVLRLPFIRFTSLGHEILHNWLGNSIYVDTQSGNWCEGLTTYCADYYYKTMKSAEDGKSYRQQINQNFSVFVHPDNDFALTEFRERTTPSSRYIGYGKSAMVFHMLKQVVGEETFYKCLQTFYQEQKFKVTSWTNIQNVFSRVANSDLTWFFRQWTERPGAPELNLTNVNIASSGDSYISSFTITQQSDPFRILLPVSITTETGVSTHTVYVERENETIRIETKEPPTYLRIDPDHDIFRKINPEEIPATINKVFGSTDQIVVYPTRGNKNRRKSYKLISENLSRPENTQLLADNQITEDLINSHSIVLLGAYRQNLGFDMIKSGLPEDLAFTRKGFRFQDKVFESPGDAIVVALHNPQNGSRDILIFSANSEDSIAAIGSKIMHYGTYSYVVFQDGKSVLKGNWDLKERSLERDLSEMEISQASSSPGISSTSDSIPAVYDTSMTRLKATACFLADPALEGRKNGSPGAIITARYLASEFMRLGLKPRETKTGDISDYLIPVPAVSGSLVEKDSYLEMVTFGNQSSPVRFGIGKDCFFYPDSTHYTDITAPVVFAGYGISAPEYSFDDYRNLDVNGNWVLVFNGEPRETEDESKFRGTKMTKYSIPSVKSKIARQHGAVGMLIVVKSDQDPSVIRYVKNQDSQIIHLEHDRSGIPVFFITEQAAGRLIEKSGKNLQSLKKYLDQTFSPESFELEDIVLRSSLNFSRLASVPIHNVIGILPGTNSYPKPHIIVGAHYDHIGRNRSGEIVPGADDNASGVSVLLETARLLKSQNIKIDRSIVFICFGAEEAGCLGSRAYVADPVFPLNQTDVMIDLDMVGRNNFDLPENDNMIIAIISAQTPELVTFSQEANEKSGLEIKYDSYVSFQPRSDHAIFHMAQIPIFFYYTGFHGDYGRSTDTCDKLNYRKMAAISVHLTDFLLRTSSAAHALYFNPELKTRTYQAAYKKPY